MKKAKFISIVVCLLFSLIVYNLNAELIDRGGGLIYDTDLDITWLQDAMYARTTGYTLDANNVVSPNPDGWMNWYDAMTWAETLVFQGYNDWRLPSALNQDGTGPCEFYGCNDSEMGHLYYTELGNQIMGVGGNNYGPFVNLTMYSAIWTNTTTSSGTWKFQFQWGAQDTNLKKHNFFVWAVRDGDVTVVPEPISSALFIIGGVTLGFRRFRKKNIK